MSPDDSLSTSPHTEIPRSTENAIIRSIIKHLMDSTSNDSQVDSRKSAEERFGTSDGTATGNSSSTVAGVDKDVQSALSDIGQLNPSHPLVQRIQQETGIEDPQLATKYAQQTVSAMKEQATKNPEGMRLLFERLHRKKRNGKINKENEDGSFLHDGFDYF